MKRSPLACRDLHDSQPTTNEEVEIRRIVVLGDAAAKLRQSREPGEDRSEVGRTEAEIRPSSIAVATDTDGNGAEKTWL